MMEVDIFLNPILAGSFMDLMDRTVDNLTTGLGGAFGAILFVIFLALLVVLLIPVFAVFSILYEEGRGVGVIWGLIAIYFSWDIHDAIGIWLGLWKPWYGGGNNFLNASSSFGNISYCITAPLIIIPVLSIPFFLIKYIFKSLFLVNNYVYKKIPKLESVKDADKPEFKVKNLIKCGMSAAQLQSEGRVLIIGGSPEEKEACRQWVEENHPEYTILD